VGVHYNLRLNTVIVVTKVHDPNQIFSGNYDFRACINHGLDVR
jgi:hypothetical protein